MDWCECVRSVALVAMAAGFCWALWPFWTAPSLEWSLVATVTHVWSVYGWLASRPVRLLVAAPFMLWMLSVVLIPPRAPPVAEGS